MALGLEKFSISAVVNAKTMLCTICIYLYILFVSLMGNIEITMKFVGQVICSDISVGIGQG